MNVDNVKSIIVNVKLKQIKYQYVAIIGGEDQNFYLASQ